MRRPSQVRGLENGADLAGFMNVARIQLGALGLATAMAVGYFVLSSRASASDVPPQQNSSFPHGKDKHKTLECSKCHSITASRIDVKEFPNHGACAGCHNMALESLAKPVIFCGVCHNGRPLSKSQSALFPFPKRRPISDFGAKFSHSSHLKPQEAGGPRVSQVGLSGPAIKTPRCTDCHKRVEPVQAALPEMTLATGHRACFECHGEKPTKPPNMFQCAECHKLGGPRSPRLFNVVKEFKHSDHDYDIRSKKKAELRLSKPPDRLCAECHESAVLAVNVFDIRLPKESYCSGCHSGKAGLPDKLSENVVETIRKSLRR